MADWRILVTDDEPYVVMAIREVLETLPATVMEANSGEEALRIARADRPDLVLLDVRMPGLDGFQVAESLKKDPATASIPLVFLSALGSSREKVRGLELGAEDYLAKPIDSDELKARVRRVLQRFRPVTQEPPARLSGGRLESMNLATLIRLFEKDRRSGTLALTCGENRGELLLVDGHVMQAAQGPRQAEAAVYHMLQWRQGEFEMGSHDLDRRIGAEVTAPNQALLMEGQRREEESRVLRQQLGASQGPMRVPTAVRAAVERQAPRPMVNLMELLDGSRDLDQVISESPFDTWVTLKVLVHLQQVGAIEVGGPDAERRGGLRLRVGLPIQYQSIDRWLQSSSFNLSAWGVFVRTSVPFDVGTQVVLQFAMPGGSVPITVTGRVIWSNPDASKWSGMGMGIEFLDLPAVHREAIEAHLAQLIASRISEEA
ncbi:MAG: TIGR02266 family protein [candidate division NC10 bacterium]|nr:TIGR02266 family protein [candidate division NC10 bacterium]